jgi:hypothetical protein
LDEKLDSYGKPFKSYKFYLSAIAALTHIKTTLNSCKRNQALLKDVLPGYEVQNKHVLVEKLKRAEKDDPLWDPCAL